MIDDAPGAEAQSAQLADPERPPVVLVVDDDDAMRTSIRRFLRTRRMKVEEAVDGSAAAALLAQVPVDVVLTDLRMPNMGGEQLLQHIAAERYGCSVLVMTAFGEIATAVSCVRAGAYGFITKPFVSNDALAVEVRNACRYKRLREHATALEQQVLASKKRQTILGASPCMRALLRSVAGVAPTSASVLVIGETGTGKELVVRALHDASPRAAQPFVSVNCASLPAELVESALFGHVRGAFSGNSPARAGLFEAAHGGTLFLDEIAELPMGAQARLLRVLETGEVRRVGGDDVREVDVRMIATSNADLRSMCARSEFRSDLYYRLGAATLRVPSLRERGDDVLLLALHFLQEHASTLGRTVPTLSPDAVETLCRYGWPGNVRELQHAMHHAIIGCAGDTLSADCLPPEVRQTSESKAWPVQLSLDPELMSAPYAEAKRKLVERFSAVYLQRLLDSAGGNASEAARRAGLGTDAFARMMARGTDLGPDAADPRAADD
jgi:two-component system response regulator HydG